MSGLPAPGEQFGRFLILDLIARGGMGVVYRAEQRELRREVALKLLPSELSDSPDFRRRFMHEAHIVARLDSPHVVRVYDAGEHEGWMYIATQLHAGDLQSFLRRHGALSLAQALELVRQVAQGLAEAHAAGVVHRDIKPANILLSPGRNGVGTTPSAVLCDFGIARSYTDEATRTRGLIGTLGYMAPERHEGGEATTAGDVYALGCVLWATLTGEAPWTGTDVSVALGHLQAPVPQLAGSSPGVDGVNALLRRALAKDPRQRYATAAELHEELTWLVDALARPADVWAVEETVRRGALQRVPLGPLDGRPSPIAKGAGTSPPSRRRDFLIVLGSAITVMLLVLGAVWAFGFVRGRADTGGPVASPSLRQEPTDAPRAADPTPARLIRCWDGSRVGRRDQCGMPTGARGLAWVFPSLRPDVCLPKAAQPRGKVVSRECAVPGDETAVIRYSQWARVSPALAHYRSKRDGQGAESTSRRGGFTRFVWRYPTSERVEDFVLSAMYAKFPYSVTVDAESAEERDRVFAELVVFRHPRTLSVRSSGR